jgi:hypothetical protein
MSKDGLVHPSKADRRVDPFQMLVPETRDKPSQEAGDALQQHGSN